MIIIGTLPDRDWWFWLSKLLPTQRPGVILALYVYGHINDLQLWDVLSHHQSPVTPLDASQIYSSLGFKPFAGYPLTPIA